MFIQKMKSILILSLLLGTTPALAQHGSVNGPQTTGPLNPVSGANSIHLRNLLLVESDCYIAGLKEMLNPFLNVNEIPPEEIITSVTPYAESIDGNARIVITIRLKNASGAYATALKLKNYTRLQVKMSFDRNKIVHRRSDDYFEFFADRLAWGEFFYKDQTDEVGLISWNGLPKVNYTGSIAGDFDPITHFKIGTHFEAYQLIKDWAGEEPSTPEQIVLYNTDREKSPTNFRFNGKKFFECVESRL